jgi:hypothetical protein
MLLNSQAPEVAGGDLWIKEVLKGIVHTIVMLAPVKIVSIRNSTNAAKEFVMDCNYESSSLVLHTDCPELQCTTSLL